MTPGKNENIDVTAPLDAQKPFSKRGNHKAQSLDESAPNDPELVAAGSAAVTSRLRDVSNHHISVVLAALRHFQGAIEAGENLSSLGDIVDLDKLDHHSINPLCEAINGFEEEANPWSLNTVVDRDGHLNLYVSHADGTEVIDIGEDLGSDSEWGCRLTTQKVENALLAPD